MPTHALRWSDDAAGPTMSNAVSASRTAAGFGGTPATGALLAATQAHRRAGPWRGEISLAARAWVSELARRLERGALLLIDYGLPRHELYHPLRDGGTVRCHYRHRVHDDPFWYPGLSDITSHVDFTAVAEAGFDAGLEVLGFTSQANFLLNCGIGDLLAASKVGAGDTASARDTVPGSAGDPSADDLRARGAVNVLISPNEMGELFKVIALGRWRAGPAARLRPRRPRACLVRSKPIHQRSTK
jgi:SAM-dependent MidA family methyltransferase